MSTQSPFGRPGAAFPTPPRGDVLGTYQTYPEAQRVVAQLAAADFPVRQVSIVGNDLKTVERVTGKLTYGRAALAGALSGLWLGFFFGIVLTLFSGAPGGSFWAAALIGAAFGMLYGVVSFSVTRRQRDFTSVHQVLAMNYQIIVDPQLTMRARQLLGQQQGGWAAGPQQFGGPQYPGRPPQGGHGQAPYGQQQPPYGQQQQPPYGQQQQSPYGQQQQPPYGQQQQQPSGQQQQPPYGQEGQPGAVRAERPSGQEARPGQPGPQAPVDEPPRYGERVSPTPTPTPAQPASDDSGDHEGAEDRGHQGGRRDDQAD
ncbi:ECF transporter S component [Curtobacterium sp. MCBD17_013]|uniref:general stress protein n=1 Tax=Curtobacterium sp. MCBD17_013 TaxID=2175668 RepID=UPI000DA99226|nr:general stress protein [Curtobacterium sp. MCBD17_013]PZF61390.1 ECF transporter S component [Curtobacterium sp. MCBD17_013]